jgi:o-succinylbenzoate---CoA ligase
VAITSSLEQISHLSWVPTQLLRHLQNPSPAPRLKQILLGGGPIPPHLLLPTVAPTYGMTEMSSQIATFGKPLPGTELKLFGDGEIGVRGPTLFQGYWNRQTGLSLPLTPDGWFMTKDIGRWEKDRLVIVGRKDNLFISGGENIQPEEIELELLALPHIEQAVVVPISDPEFGERPVAFVTTAHLQTGAILSHLKAKLPSYKLPLRIFPLDIGIKPNRPALKQLAQQLIATA